MLTSIEVSCKICRKKIIAGISSSSNLRRHYKAVHHTKLDEYDSVKCVKKCVFKKRDQLLTIVDHFQTIVDRDRDRRSKIVIVPITAYNHICL